ncbi:MAG: peptide MFS transporter [Gemmatimonadota bacterium]
MTPTSSDTGFFGHPRGLSTLFFTEMWERFSYYGLRAILILFMTAAVTEGGLGWDVGKAGAVYGIYVALVYMLSLPGGWVADKLLGLRKSVLYGGILIMFGQLTLALPGSTLLFPGLGLIVLGTGLLKPNVSAIVGELYSAEDVRRDSGFTIFYMGINLGAFLSPLVVGSLAQSARFRELLTGWGLDPTSAWHWGFGVGALGMFLGLIQYRLGWKHLGDAGVRPSVDPASPAGADARKMMWIGGGGIAALIAVVAALIMTGTISLLSFTSAFSWIYLAVVVGFFAALFGAGTWSAEERKRLIVVLVLFVGAAIFWAAFEQAPSTLNLFARDNTRNSIFGQSFPSSWFQSVNALFIIIFAPVFAWFWIKLGTKNPSSPAKFAVGLLLVGLGFLVMVGAARASANGVLVSPMWLVVTYLLHTFGELCLSPVGLSSMTRLAPDRVKGMIMGVWFLAASMGNLIAGQITRFYADFTVPQIFGAVTAFCLVSAAVMFLLVKPIRRMMEAK